MGSSCAAEVASVETETADCAACGSGAGCPAAGAAAAPPCAAVCGSNAAPNNAADEVGEGASEAALGSAAAAGSSHSPPSEQISQAVELLQQGVDSTSQIPELRALRERIVNDVVKKIDAKVGVLSEFSVTVSTLSGQTAEITGLRPEDTLSVLHARWRAAVGSDAGHLQFCCDNHAFTPEESNRPLLELGIEQGSMLLAVVTPDAKPMEGALAALCWLRDHADLNGTIVRVQQYHEEPQRFEVRAEDSGLLFKVKRENLLIKPTPVWETSPEMQERLSAGSTVRIFGLKKDPEYNGRTGTIVELARVDFAGVKYYNIRLANGAVKVARGTNLEPLQRSPR